MPRVGVGCLPNTHARGTKEMARRWVGKRLTISLVPRLPPQVSSLLDHPNPTVRAAVRNAQKRSETLRNAQSSPALAFAADAYAFLEGSLLSEK